MSTDSYMNLQVREPLTSAEIDFAAFASRVQLTSADEYVNGEFEGNLGEILIRCNNVLYIRGLPEGSVVVQEPKGTAEEAAVAGDEEADVQLTS